MTTRAGLSGVHAGGQITTAAGKEAFRILVVGDGPEGWAILAAGPNSARSETIFREMLASIQVSN